jgi:hypothetical protein
MFLWPKLCCGEAGTLISKNHISPKEEDLKRLAINNSNNKTCTHTATSRDLEIHAGGYHIKCKTALEDKTTEVSLSMKGED